MGNKKGNKLGRIAMGRGSHDNRFILERFPFIAHTQKAPFKMQGSIL